MQELAHDRSIHRLLDTSVVQHHEGAVAAQFERGLLEMLATASDATDAATHLGGAGEGEQARHTVLDEGAARQLGLTRAAYVYRLKKYGLR